MTRNPMLRKLRAVLLVLVLGATGWFVHRFGRRTPAAAPAAGPARVWVVDDGQFVLPGDQPVTGAVWDGRTIHLAGARNEVLGLQVAVRPGAAVLAARLACEPLGNGGRVIAVNRWQVFREHLL
ncbi:MAG: hypothetical protein HYU66_04155, partial [Armatimonadetes bacterium]|nr:hypothetical protein [Armatimonadota bacterium]